MIDAYLVIQGLTGETKDTEMAAQKAMEIQSFGIGSSDSLAEKAKEREEKRNEERDKEMEDDGNDLRLKGHKSVGSTTSMLSPTAKDEPEQFAFTISKEMDSASPGLFHAYVSAVRPTGRKVFPTATVYLRRSGGAATGAGLTFLQFDFEEVSVLSYRMRSQGNRRPVEDITFRFFKQRMHYYPQLKSGANDAPVIAGWDVKLYEAL